MHYYQFHIADYRKDTVHLSPMEHFIYRQLIDWYYLDEKPIPRETQVVMRRLGLGSSGLSELENVLNDFFKMTQKGWTHSRIERDLNGYNEKRDISRRNGSKGGRPKKQELSEAEKPRKTQPVISGNPDVTQTKPNHKPITNNHKPITNNQEPLTNNQGKKNLRINGKQKEFESFWKIYPKRKNKGQALKAWIKITNPVETLDLITQALSWQARSPDWTKNGGQYIPYPATYLNAEAWMDEPTAPPMNGADEWLAEQMEKDAAIDGDFKHEH